MQRELRTWRVVYTGTAWQERQAEYAEMYELLDNQGLDPTHYDERNAERETVEAEELFVYGGALVFTAQGEVQRVVGPAAYREAFLVRAEWSDRLDADPEYEDDEGEQQG